MSLALLFAQVLKNMASYLPAGSVLLLHQTSCFLCSIVPMLFKLDNIPAVLFNMWLCLGRGCGLVNFESSQGVHRPTFPATDGCPPSMGAALQEWPAELPVSVFLLQLADAPAESHLHPALPIPAWKPGPAGLAASMVTSIGTPCTWLC